MASNHELPSLRSSVIFKYQYESLPSSNSIRLLELFPGASQDPLVCRLFVVDIQEAPTYAAISYVWGDPEDTVAIEVECKSKAITVNLNDALHRVRYRTDIRVSWADAICINQEDLQERAQQVGLMGSIFRNAKPVLAWFGPDDGDAEEVFALIRKTNTMFKEQTLRLGLKNVPELQPEDVVRDDERTWRSLAKMLCREWFYRCWIVQEICLANFAFALCGNATIDCEEIFKFSRWIILKGEAFGFHFALRTTQVFSMTTNYRQDLQETVGRLGFYDILCRGRDYRASDPRDHVYAFLSTPSARLGDAIIAQADYTKLVPELYTEIAVKIIGLMKNLTLLSRVQHRAVVSLENDFPSWVPLWNQRGVAIELGEYRCYAAARPETLYETIFSSNVLQVRGLHFDIVDNHSETMEAQHLTAPTQKPYRNIMARLISLVEQYMHREARLLHSTIGGSQHLSDRWIDRQKSL
jgi:hypothetical protein